MRGGKDFRKFFGQVERKTSFSEKIPTSENSGRSACEEVFFAGSDFVFSAQAPGYFFLI
jgi:hypothetical protein